MRDEYRKVALGMLERAHGARNEAERRMWQVRDEVVHLKTLLAQAEASERLATAEYERAQDLLRDIWVDFRPGGVWSDEKPKAEAAE